MDTNISATPNTNLVLPANIADKSTLDVLMKPILERMMLLDHGAEKPTPSVNPFERKNLLEIVSLLGDAATFPLVSTLTATLIYFTRNSSVKLTPSLYKHHFDLLELERLAYNNGNDAVPPFSIAALQKFLITLPDYDTDKIGHQSSLTHEAFATLVAPVSHVLAKYEP